MTMLNGISDRPHIVIFGLISKHSGRNRGGTSFSIARLARHFASRGRSVAIVCHRSAVEQPALKELPSNVSVHGLRSVTKVGLLVELYRYVRTARPKSVLALDTRANLLACKLKRLPGVNLRVHASLRNAVESKTHDTNRRRERRIRRIFRLIEQRSDGVVAISHGLAEQFRHVIGYSSDKVHVIHNLVVDQRLYDQLETPPEHAWLRDPTTPVILGVGRLTPVKGFDVLLRAFAQVQKTQSAKLIILGEGAERDRLLCLADQLNIAQHVDLPGFVTNPAAYMAQADVFASSSRAEGFGMVLAEALAVGCPVVSTDCPSGPREILDGGRYGDLVPVDDVDALAEALTRALIDPRQKSVLLEGAERFSAARNGDRYLEMLLPGHQSQPT